ncbi:HAD family hydrolase [Arthrobacter sp. NPDC092385]|uniref:HAD family hydrolase n=1 Tax=Arthrobacter sp. NPDC092385 TaxID=3363943 RepID=UPI00381D2779
MFDVGETLVDESRAWTTQAERAGVTPFALMGTLGALMAHDKDHRGVWDVLGVERPAEPPSIDQVDLYPDALSCLKAARDAGLVVGIAGNQPIGVEARLHELGFEANFIASSAAWGVAKPSAEFFSRIVQATRLDASAILYVGDRLDNDILPARTAGMRTAFIRRGPWGYLHAQRPEVDLADMRLESLAELTTAFTQYRRDLSEGSAYGQGGRLEESARSKRDSVARDSVLGPAIARLPRPC